MIRKSLRALSGLLICLKGKAEVFVKTHASAEHIYCAFDLADEMTFDSRAPLFLRYHISWGENDPKQYQVRFPKICSTQKKGDCKRLPRTSKMHKDRSGKSGTLQIPADSLRPGTASNLMIHLHSRGSNSMLKNFCQVRLIAVEEKVTTVPVRLHSDAPYVGQIDPDEDHTFSCEIDLTMQNYTLPAKYEVNYITDLVNLQTKQRVFSTEFYDITDNQNSIKVQRDFFEKD